jgi:HemK-like putative methylase
VRDTLASPTTARFMGLELEVLPDVLVPREETELLCRASFDILRARPAPQIVIDMCCGAGNLACAVACEFPDAIVFGSDLTDNCVGAARRNVERLGLVGSVQVFQGDLFEGLRRADLAGRADLVICNPPYISTARLAGEKAHLLEAEPREAFDGGPYGLSIHQRVIAEAPRYLKSDGWLALEFGAGQHRQIAALLKRAGGFEEPDILDDEAGIPRAVRAKRRDASS